ncbi:MAG: hypothetical protein IK139_08775 [Lachnospiraceae bacterium]|nr:hypothetical protein [Lachnospiraceae bacterium]
MKDNDTYSKSEKVMLGEDELEAVYGGTGGTGGSIELKRKAFFYGRAYDGIPVACAKAGVTLTGVSQYNNSWYVVPVRQNFGSITMMDPDYFFGSESHAEMYLKR